MTLSEENEMIKIFLNEVRCPDKSVLLKYFQRLDEIRNNRIEKHVI